MVTPPYPDYASGHACITGAASNTFGYLFRQDSLDLVVIGPPFLQPDAEIRHFQTIAALDEETMNARIWLGLHFRKAMTDANQLGHDVSDWVIAHDFRAPYCKHQD